jgi:hypothetical protein
MKTYFVEIVCNNKGKTHEGTHFLRAVIKAKNKEEAGTVALIHFQPHYTAGENGVYKIQCNWEVSVPTREIIEKHWKKASLTDMPIAVHDNEGKTIGHRYFKPDTTKEKVMRNWDIINYNWSNPVVYFEPLKGGYVVAVQCYMCMPCELRFFKGLTAETYKKAKQWVKDNTLKENYFCEV